MPINVLALNSAAELNQALTTNCGEQNFLLLHIKQAALQLCADNIRFDLSAASILSLPGVQQLEIGPSDVAFSATLMVFDRAQRDQMLIDSFSLFCPYYGSRLWHLEAAKQARAEFLIAGLLWLHQNPSKYLQQERAWVLQMLVDVIDESLSEKTDWGSLSHPLMQRFFIEVNSHFRQSHQVEHYTQRIGTTPRTLLRLMRDHIGITPKDFIAHRLNTEAKRLLINTPHPAQQIAYELGFATPEYFNVFFKRLNQMSPNDFRRGL